MTTAKSMANSLLDRLTALVPTLASDLSPSLSYLSTASVQINERGTDTPEFAWTAPDLNNGEPYTIQVECIGGGGGGGGGSPTVGAGGGGGGEYACETQYPIVPGETYSYYAGLGAVAGQSGSASTATGDSLLPGGNGDMTHFDLRGKGMDGGVQANGGQGGDQSGIGVGGRGGTGSANTIHFDGGGGGSPTSGVMSDNPILGTSDALSSTILWWRLDDNDTGDLYARDFTEFNRHSVSRVRNSGAIVAPTKEIACPVQVPFGAATTWDGVAKAGEKQGNCWKWDHGSGSGYIGGLVAASDPGSALSNLSVSCWVKGLSTASSATDWGDSSSGQKMLVGNKDITISNDKGWNLFIDVGTAQVKFGATDSGGSTTSHSCAAPAANDGNWHMITVTWKPGSNNVVLYIDGVAASTSTTGLTTIAPGNQPIMIGFNQPTLSASFKGYMSNVWISTAYKTSAYVSAAFGTTPATGGGGGGASGGSSGTGAVGANPVTTVGGAGGSGGAASQPGINHGGGTGGNGGNATVTNGATAGSAGPPTGGGGGGSGTKAGTGITYTAYIPCNMSASYAGFDSQGANGGQLYSLSANPQQDITSPWYSTAAQQEANAFAGGRGDSPFQGSMFSILTFPAFNAINGNAPAGGLPIPLSDSSWTLDDLSLQLTVNTTAATNLVIGTWKSNAIFASLPNTNAALTGATYGLHNKLLLVHIEAGDAGRQVTIDLSTVSAILTDFTNQGSTTGCGLILGQLLGTDVPTYGFGAWNADEAEDWRTEFYGANAADTTTSATLIVKYHAAAGTKNNGGKGAAGYIVLTYVNSQGTPVATVLPAAITDAGGHALGAGFTADSTSYQVWHPGSNPRTLETWQVVSSYTGTWTRLDSTSDIRYQMVPGNKVHILGRLVCNTTFAATNSVLFTISSTSYRPARNVPVYMMGHNSGLGNVAAVWGFIDTSGVVQVVGSMNATQVLEINAVYPLD